MKTKEKAGYKKCINSVMVDLKQIRPSCQAKMKSRKVNYQLEKIPRDMKKTANILGLSDENIRIPMNISGYAE